jgi:hypothetical protein
MSAKWMMSSSRISLRFTIGKEVAMFREAVRLQMDLGVRKFVWNLREVETIESVALGELVSVYTWVRS